MADWDGLDRRKDGGDHDLLIRIDQNLTNHISRMNIHFIEDEKNFGEVNKRLGVVESWLWRGLGAIGVIVFAMKVIPLLIK